MSAKVFISYRGEDYEIAKRLYDGLKAVGFNPWMDREDILIGQNRKIEIRQAIQESSYFLVLLSEKSLSDRGYFHKELKTALEILDEIPPSDIFILPVRLDACKSVYENLQDIQHTDLFPSYDEGFRQIVRVLESPGDEKESRCFADKRVLEKLAGIRVESGRDSVFAKDSGKAGIVKDSQGGVIGDSAKVEGGIHQHFYQGTRLWIAVALFCIAVALIFFGRPDTEQNIRGNNNTAVITGDGDVSISRESE